MYLVLFELYRRLGTRGRELKALITEQKLKALITEQNMKIELKIANF